MIDSEEEYVEYEYADERRAQLFHLGDTVSRCSTLSASESDTVEHNYSTPPPSRKFKKVRVLLKKLPRNVLAKYRIGWRQTTPLRSKRIKDKHIPVGKYLAVHKNKPLLKLQDKKILPGNDNLKILDKNKFESQNSKLLKHNILSEHSYLKRNTKSSDLSDGTTKTIPRKTYSLNSAKLSSNKYESTINNKSSLITSTKNADKSNTSTSNSYRNLNGKVAAAGVNYKPNVTSLPQLGNVDIVRHNVPPTPRHHFALDKTSGTNTFTNSNRSSILQNVKALVPDVSPSQKPHCPTNAQSKVYPAFITPARSVYQSRPVISSNRSINPTTGGVQSHRFSPNRKITIRAIKMPSNTSKSIYPIPVGSPRISVVNQPLLEMDPLNAPCPVEKCSKQAEIQTGRENTADNSSDICLDSDTDFEQMDVEKQVEPEVIKRIIYHSKSVQTKFTCNSSICGLVDTDEFNLNCFYCYEIFPLHKWLEFKEHIKHVHKVEEGSEPSDSEVDVGSTSSQNRQENCTQNMRLAPTGTNVNENEEQHLAIKPVTPTQPVYKKLPLEPRLLAQRQNTILTETCQIISSTPANSKPSQIVAPSEKHLKFSNSKIGEVISIDSDDNDSNSRTPVAVKTAAKQHSQVDRNKTLPLDVRVEEISDVKLILPSLPHITIKKIQRPASKVNNDASVKASEPTPNENPIRIPPNTNVPKFYFKTLPTSTQTQLPAANGNTKPRYFVVKKIIKLPTQDQDPKDSNSNTPEVTMYTKMPDLQNSNVDLIEDSVPKPTTGLGILFGLTNSMVVIEFLLKLKTFPELWRCQDNVNAVKYEKSLKKMCHHLNNRFDLNMTEIEMLLSIQRVKDWYYLMLQSIRQHNNDPNNTEPYKHRFPIYFRILSQYLTPEDDEKGNRLNEIISKTTLAAQASTANLKEKAPSDANETSSKSFVENLDTRRSSTTASATSPSTEPFNKNNSQNQECNADSLIEFDADTLYDQKSSEDETFDEFEEFFKTKPKKPLKKTTKADGTERSRTKVYVGRFECDMCHKVYKRNCDLKRHRVFHFPPEFECSRCSEKFYLKHWADRCSHDKRYGKYKKVDKASGEKRIWPKKICKFNMICEICGNSYRSIGSLNTHKRDKHFNQRNACVVCNFTALSNWRVVQHQRKRHIVEPGLPEDVAKKSRARTESKSSFSNEARQAFDWRREMRKQMKPGEKFYGCCRCKIVFTTRKEKVLHNKIEHPITEFTVICLLCLPNKLILSNSNCARRHYIDIHKVPWYEIDSLVKSTKPIFNLLNNEEIELLKASENYKELLEELLKDKELQIPEYIPIPEDEASKAINELKLENANNQVESSQEENLFPNGVADSDNYNESNHGQVAYSSLNEHNYSEEQVTNETFSEFDVLVDNSREEELSGEEEPDQIDMSIESNECRIENYIDNGQEYVENIVEEFIEGEFIDGNLIVEEYIDEVIVEDDGEFI